MTTYRRTHRQVDGQRVAGVARLVFLRSLDTYQLSELAVYADGVIDCGTGGPTDLDGLAGHLRSGTVATTLDEGALVVAHRLGRWRFAEPRSAFDAEMLLGEVADEIDRLNDRPTSIGRCMRAVRDYLDDPSEPNRLVVRERYHAIPRHLRVYALADMDRKDRPLRVLAADPGESVDGRVVTAESHARAVEYFRRTGFAATAWHQRVPADGPEHATRATVTIPRAVFPSGWPDPPGVEVLQNDYPATVATGGRTYPSVTHAYWALSTPDAAWHDRITAADRGITAAGLAAQAPRRDDWAAARLAVMAALLRAKYTGNPGPARILRATGDARLIYGGADSAYWSDSGTNWVGRLLEVIRSELAAGPILTSADG